MISIRSARLEDLDILLGFEQGIVEAERPFDPTLKPGEINYYDIAALIKNSDAEVLVAQSGAEIVGSGYILKKKSDDYRLHNHHAHIGFLYVKPSHRKRGVNKLILDGLISWAQSQNLTEIQLEVYQDNIPALRAYEKAGFIPSVLRMRLDP